MGGEERKAGEKDSTCSEIGCSGKGKSGKRLTGNSCSGERVVAPEINRECAVVSVFPPCEKIDQGRGIAGYGASSVF